MDDTAPEAKGTKRYQCLSVIIPAYNAAHTICEQLEALRRQNYDGEWEIVVVDNGSTDNTADIVRSFQELMPHLRPVAAPERHHRSYARNRGVQAARGDVLLFCDADDVVAQNWVSAMARVLDEHDFVAGSVELQELNPQFPSSKKYSEHGAKVITLGFLPSAPSGNMAVSRQAFEAVGGFSEDFARLGDIDLSWRLQLSGYELCDAPEAVVHYRRHWQSIGDSWRRSVLHHFYEVELYRHFKGMGMPPPAARDIRRKYFWLLRHLPYLWSADVTKRRRYLQRVGASWGRIKGSVHYHVLFL